MTIDGNTIQIFPNIVSVEGEEARKFLQALISADISSLEPKRSQYSLLLNASGKTQFAFVVFCMSDNHFLLLNEGSSEGNLSDALKRFLIRTKAEIKDVSKDYQVGVGFSISSEDVLRESDRKLADNVFGDPRLNMVLKKRHSEVNPQDLMAYEYLRISHGAVSVIKDLGDNSIAQEAGLERSSVSFNKGCFMGQELVCRIDSRSATTPNTYFAMKVNEYASIESADVFCDDDLVGVVTSSIDKDINKGMFSSHFGEFNAIAQMSRKGAAQLQDSTCEKFYVKNSDGEKYSISKIEKTNGYFRI